MIWDDEFAQDEYDSANWSIWNELEELVWHWQETYKDYWASDSLTDKQKTDAKANRDIADVIIKMVAALSVAGAADKKDAVNVSAEDLKKLRKALRAQKHVPTSYDWISLCLAADATKRLHGATDRTFRLVSLLQGRMLSERAAAYLARVSSLFVNGMEVETAAMCRSALEAALVERLRDEIDMNGHPPSLDDLLQIAGERGFLDGYEIARNQKKWRAHRGSTLHEAVRLKYAGNYVMHVLPTYPTEEGEIASAFEAVRALTRILRLLFPPAEDQP